MLLSPGLRVGPYEIVAPLGAGGMGEVYRARDIRLKREVAIKVLPAAFAADGERVARFRREAELLATLNHPNIAIVHGLEESDGVVAIAMELVDGQSLAVKLDEVKTGLPVAEALAIARQIGDGLEAAHDKGIVHRDLKPGNIMLTHDGRVKILDFGLARLEPVAPAGASQLTHSPTLTFAATHAGVILGTAAYMSPEQAKGRIADKRSDVWAFGCVLYEMLTGKRAFDGEDVSDVLATVLKSEPDWTAFPPGVSEPVRNIVKRALAKDRKSRIPDMAVVRFLLDDAAHASPLPNVASVAPVKSGLAWKVATALVLLTTAVGFGAWYVARPVSSAVVRFQILPPAKGAFVVTTAGSTPVAPHAVISPDGATIAFAVRDAGGKVSLWLRPINSIAMQPLPGTEGASYPFWSPDSRFIGYFAGGKLMKISATGGPPQTLCSATGRGATWSRDGIIVFNGGPGPLLRVASGGGEPTPVTKDSASFPSFLPDGRHFLHYRNGSFVEVASIDDGTSRRLLDADSGAVYSPSGHLLFVRQGTLMAQSFDPRSLSFTGDPFPVAENVQTGTPPGHISFSVSDTGVLAFGGAASDAGAALQLTWMNRQGKVIGTFGGVQDIRGIDLSPDDTQLATHVHVRQGGDIWLSDLSRATTARFTFDATQDNSSPVWSPDGATIAFASRRSGKGGVYRKAANGTSTEEMLVEHAGDVSPTGWSADGGSLVYSPVNARTGADLFLLPLAANSKPVALVASRGTDLHGQPSPNGKWMTYDSAESGTIEVYVQAFPQGSGKWQVSSGGGRYPRWRHDSGELFYLSGQSFETLMAVDVNSIGSTFERGTVRTLFDTGYVFHPHGTSYNAFAVTRDGQRFLIPRPPSTVTESATALPVTVVMNWFQELKNTR